MLLKDIYNEDYVQALGDALSQVHPDFEVQALHLAIFTPAWAALELKQRMRHITHSIRTQLPDDYRDALAVLYQAAPLMASHGFPNMVFSDFVEVYGLDDPDASIPALANFTQLVSAEFAVRPFIIRYPERMMPQMLEWAHSDNPHHRRLASEGCRSRLPWGIAIPALKTDPSPILPILNQLKCDPVESVRRSVSNNLNDISKDHPEIVLDLLTNWRDIECPGMPRLIEHALRTLVKQGNTDALQLLGYGKANIEITNLRTQPNSVVMGEKTRLSFDLRNPTVSTQRLMIDYVVHFVRANEKTSPKVFKLSKRILDSGKRVHLERSIDFRPITTRRYYPGKHRVSIQINGEIVGSTEFDLTSA